MDKLTLCSIVGARPNFIKLAALSPEIRKVANEIIIHTGQHYDYEMSKGFFDELNIPTPDFHLDVKSSTHGEMTGEMLRMLDPVLKKESPDAVIVYGDTNSTLAGALSAAKMHIPIVHIESGARSFDRRMPEEINRIIVDHISDILICSTATGYMNLESEGIPIMKIHVRGDVITDIMAISKEIPVNGFEQDYNLLTIHREENSSIDVLVEIVEGLKSTGERFIFPCHPRLQSLLQSLPINDQFLVIPPAGYWEMRYLETHAKRIVTDSGGVQKEAYILKKPCITLRKNTEWIETLDGGWNILAGNNRDVIAKSFKLEPMNPLYKKNLFGSPGSCRTIAKVIVEELHG